MLRNSTIRFKIIVISVVIYIPVFAFFLNSNGGWTQADYAFIDLIYKMHLRLGYGPEKSNHIVYLTIDDLTYKKVFRKNQFDRIVFSDVIKTLSRFKPEAIGIDLIFATASDPVSDSTLIHALKTTDDDYLPVAFALSLQDRTMVTDSLFEFIKSKFTKQPKTKGDGKPYKGFESLLQMDSILRVIDGIGHISEISDGDGIYRHSSPIIWVDSVYLPSLPLAIYLKTIGVDFDELTIEWGDKITIPGNNSKWLNEDFYIPIDEYGRTFVPYVDSWGRDFDNMSLITFIKNSESAAVEPGFSDFFEGRIVLIGDISTGITDIANTTIDKNVPLLTLQSSMLNGFITQSFYDKASIEFIFGTVTIICIIIFFLTLLKNPIPFIISSFVFLITSIVVGSMLIVLHLLIPVITLSGSIVYYFVVLSVALQLILSKETKIIEQENIRRSHELEEARKIQLSMLPTKLPEAPNLEISAFMKTATEVGGDYYDFDLDKNGTLTIAVGDATGHGLRAGMMVTITKSLFTFLSGRSDLKEIISSMNQCIKDIKLHILYMCFLLVRINGSSLKIVSAGMPPLLKFDKATESITEVKIKSMPLGATTRLEFKEEHLNINRGDIILLMTDGLMELFNSKRELFELNRIKEILLEAADKNTDEIVIAFKSAIEKWTEIISDDVTLIIVKVL